MDVAPELLNKRWQINGHDVRIIEVEAYTADDPASHSFRGLSARNAPMFGEPGRLYVYLIYGMHHCANVVTGDVGDGQAVLIRAVDTVTGPGRLCRELGIDRTHNGNRVTMYDDGAELPHEPLVTPRIGITKAADWPRRWLVTQPRG
jgi:DNA-3-methyladenine glycosylase